MITQGYHLRPVEIRGVPVGLKVLPQGLDKGHVGRDRVVLHVGERRQLRGHVVDGLLRVVQNGEVQLRQPVVVLNYASAPSVSPHFPECRSS